MNDSLEASRSAVFDVYTLHSHDFSGAESFSSGGNQIVTEVDEVEDDVLESCGESIDDSFSRSGGGEGELRNRRGLRSVIPATLLMFTASQSIAGTYDSLMEYGVLSSSVLTVGYNNLAGDELSDRGATLVLKQKTPIVSIEDAQLFLAIAQEIEQSRDLLSLKYDWDEAGAHPIREETWARASKFLLDQAKHAYRTLNVLIPCPVISAVADGSIDLHWKEQDMELLVNIPESQTAPASFYGDDFGAVQIRGTVIDKKPARALLSFLLKT